MEDKATRIESLLEKAEVYVKKNLALFKLNAIDKTADIASTILSKLAIIVVALFVVGLLNIALSLWIGELTGKLYFGFLIVAGVNVLILLILIFKRGAILKAPLNDFFILQILKEKKK